MLASMITEKPLSHGPSNKSILVYPYQKTGTTGFVDSTEKVMKRSIHFHDTTSLLWIERTESMSDKEFDACYYNSRDYSCFRDRDRRISRNLSNWSFMKGGRKGDFLGVESRLQRFHRRQRSKNAVFAVILEQELRQESGHKPDSHYEEDALAIARVYQQHTRESVRLARERASKNASQVERTDFSFVNFGGESTDEMEKEKREDIGVATTNLELPWEIPAKKKTKKQPPTDTIRYTTCSYPVLSSYYLESLQCNEQDTLRKQSQESQELPYKHHPELQNLGMFNENGHKEKPDQQKIIRTQKHCKPSREVVSHTLKEHQSSHQHEVIEKTYTGTTTQQWVWNAIQYDVVPPTSIILSWV